MNKHSSVALAFCLFLAGSVCAQSPISDDFDDGLGPQWSFVTIGNGPTKDGAPSVGGVEVVDGQLHLSSNGWNVWEDQDAMAFLYQKVTGDFDVLVRVVSFDGTLDGDPNAPNNTPPNGGNEWEKAGILFRQGVRPEAPYVSVMLSRSYGFRTQYRLTPAEETKRAWRGNDGSGPKAGWWIRLTRTGDQFLQRTASTLVGPWLEADDNLQEALPNQTLVINDTDQENPAVLGLFYTPHSGGIHGGNFDVMTGTGILDGFMTYDDLVASSAGDWEVYR